MAAFTTNTFNIVTLPTAAKEWNLSLYNADISGCEDILAAEAGYTHYLTYLKIRTATAMTVTIGSGEDTSAVDTIHIGPIPFDAASGIEIFTTPHKKGLQFTEGAAITADASSAGAIWIEARGFSAKV